LLEDRKHYHTCGVPCEGARIRDLPIDTDVAAAFDSFVTHPPRFRVTTDGASYEETLTATINEAGQHELQTQARKATLTVRLTERSFFAIAFSGDRNSILSLLYLGLGRMPFSCEPGVFWSDELDPHALLNSWGGLWQDLVGPFVGMPTVHTRSTTSPVHGAIAEVQTELSPVLHGAALQRIVAQRIIVQMSKRSGIASIRSESKTGSIQAESIHVDTQ
jgi:hypothetical protein